MGEKIVLGLGDNIDYEIRWDSSIIEQLIHDYNLEARDITTNLDIKTERDLLITIIGFLKENTGGERFVSEAAVIERFSGLFEKKITVGGTSIRAAIAMAKLGHPSALHLVTINEHVKRLLPQTCSWICSNNNPSSYPHLIVQYHANTRIDSNDIHLKTSRANRVIYTNDLDNEQLPIHPDLAELLADAEVFLISGFNSIQNMMLAEDRLQTIREILQKLPPHVTVFLEDACYHRPEIGEIIRKNLIKYIDIYSLNEDELENYCKRPVILTNPDDMRKALEELHIIIPCDLLVVHTRFWALAYGKQAASYKKALLGGITMATTRFRFGDDFTQENYIETGRLLTEEKGTLFAQEIQHVLGSMVCCIPSFFVPEQDVTTIGLGDAFVGGFLPTLTGQGRAL
jgi:ADP-dependent phosphofructokinase/glucokinase